MAEEVGLIVNVRTRAAAGQLKKLQADVNGAVQQGAQKAFEKPAPIKGFLSDFRTKYDPAKGFTERAPGAAPPARDAAPMSGILGGAAGGSGGMLGPLAALTIVGKGMSDMLGKVVGILATASPAFGASLKLIQKTLMMFLRPIGDLLASVLRPIARMMMQANREARREALKYGRPGSVAYTAVYGGALFYNLVRGITYGVREAIYLVMDAVFGVGTGDKLRSFISDLDSATIPAITTTLETISNVIDTILTNIKDILEEVGNIAIFLSPLAYILDKLDLDIGKVIAPVAEELTTGAGLLKLHPIGLLGDKLGWYASGGYVPATPGGRIVGLAEAGEGEWIVPDSKVQRFASSVMGGGGTVVNNLYLQGPVFGVDDLDRRVNRLMDAAAKRSRRS